MCVQEQKLIEISKYLQDIVEHAKKTKCLSGEYYQKLLSYGQSDGYTFDVGDAIAGGEERGAALLARDILKIIQR